MQIISKIQLHPFPKQLPKLCFLLCTLFALQSCGVIPVEVEQNPEPEAGEQALSLSKQEKPEPPEQPFEPDTLYNLLVGELSVLEQDLGSAVDLYSHEAVKSQDAGVAERAALLARYHRDSDNALKMAGLWYELAPDSEKAIQNYADILTRTNRPIEALNILEQAHQNNIAVNFEVLRNGRMSKEQREQMLKRLAPLNQEVHSNESLLFTYTLLLQSSDRDQEALDQVARLRDIVDGSYKLALLEASLLSKLERHEDAARVLNAELANTPHNKRLHIQYARTLSKFDMSEAEKEFAALLEKSPKDVKLLMAHALAAIENQHFAEAKNSLARLITMHRSLDFAHYHLGEIANQEENFDKAIEHYRLVQIGEYFPPATQAILKIYRDSERNQEAINYLELLRNQFPQLAARLWSFESSYHRQENNYDAAYETLSRGIEQHPDNTGLRIERSYISDHLDQIDNAEVDLRWVIQREPNNASALNALGYMLTIKTNRYNEALDLIEKAIILEPNDPAIRDSLGWVYYKLGRTQEAEVELVRAFQAFPDDEIAAHLIELYWKTGQKSKGRELYRSLKKQKSDFPKVEALIDELAIRW